jgi:hypothetical protein
MASNNVQTLLIPALGRLRQEGGLGGQSQPKVHSRLKQKVKKIKNTEGVTGLCADPFHNHFSSNYIATQKI